MAIPLCSPAITPLHQAVKLDSPRSGDESAQVDIFSDMLRTAGQATDVSSYAVAEDEKEQQAVVFQEETDAPDREPVFDFLPLNPLQTMQQDLTPASVLHMKPESMIPPAQQTGFSQPAVNTPVQNVNGFDDVLARSGFSKRAFLKELPQDNHQPLVFPGKAEAMLNGFSDSNRQIHEAYTSALEDSPPLSTRQYTIQSIEKSNQPVQYFQPLPPSPYVKPTQDGQCLDVNNALNNRVDGYDTVPFSACLGMDDDQSQPPTVELSLAYPQAVAVAREALEASHAAVIKTQNPAVHEKGFPDSAALYTQHLQDSGGVGTDTMLTKALLKIYQAELGEVVAKIEVFDHKTTLNLVTESSNVRDLLEAHMGALKNNFLQVDQMPLETHVEHHFSDDKRQQRPQPDTLNEQTSAQADVFEKKRDLDKTSLIDAYI